MTTLADMLRLWRTVNRLSLRATADAIDISAPTLMRIEQGRACDLATWLKLQAWLLAETAHETGEQP